VASIRGGDGGGVRKGAAVGDPHSRKWRPALEAEYAKISRAGMRRPSMEPIFTRSSLSASKGVVELAAREPSDRLPIGPVKPYFCRSHPSS